MFFMISGMASSFFKTQKRGFLVYLKAKFMRLIVPLLISVPAFLVPRLYFSQSYETIGVIGGDVDWNFFTYV